MAVQPDTDITYTVVSKTSDPDYFKGATQLFRTSGGWGFALRVIGSLAVVYGVLAAITLPRFMQSMANFSMSVEGDPENFEFVNLGGFFGAILLLSVLYLIPAAMGAAAVHRKVLFDAEAPGVPIRLGRDTVNLMLTYLGLFGLGFLGLLVFVVILAGVVGVIAGISAAGGSGSGTGAMIIAVVAIVVIYIGIFVAMAWFAVRFSAAGAATVHAGRPVILGARRITKGRFWQLFGIYVIAYIFATIVSTVFSLLAAIPMGASVTELMLNPGAAADAYQMALPNLVIFGLFYGLSTAVSVVWLAGVGGYALRWYLHDRGRTGVFD